MSATLGLVLTLIRRRLVTSRPCRRPLSTVEVHRVLSRLRTKDELRNHLVWHEENREYLIHQFSFSLSFLPSLWIICLLSRFSFFFHFLFCLLSLFSFSNAIFAFFYYLFALQLPSAFSSFSTFCLALRYQKPFSSLSLFFLFMVFQFLSTLYFFYFSSLSFHTLVSLLFALLYLPFFFCLISLFFRYFLFLITTHSFFPSCPTFLFFHCTTFFSNFFF